MKFFEAKEGHAEQAVKLVNSAYRGDSGKQGWTTESDLLDGQRLDTAMFLDMIQKGVILLFGEENDPMGSVFLELEGDSAYIGMLTVSPLQQNQGLGKKILEIAQDFAVEKWKVKYAKMTVISKRKELLDFYARRGFELTGEKEPFPQDPKFGIPKCSDLEFVVLKKIIKP